MPDTSRLFFALWPDDETRQTLARLKRSLPSKDFKWVQPHNLHVTLVFLGHVDPATELAIKQSVNDISAQPFTLTFDSLSYWSKPRILCLSCKQVTPEAAKLAAELDIRVRANGLLTDSRPYIPHITLARHACHVPDIKFEPIAWRAEAFCLVESCSETGGVRYKVIQQWPFINPTANLD